MRPTRPKAARPSRLKTCAPSGQRCPRAVRISARRAARGLRTSVNIDGLCVRAAVLAVLDVSRTRHNRSIAAAIRVAPADWRTRGAAFQRVHLGLVGQLLVALVQRSTDAV